MPSPRYYTTSVEAGTSVSEIGELLRRHGCRSYSVQWDGNGDPQRVEFVMPVPDLIAEDPSRLLGSGR